VFVEKRLEEKNGNDYEDRFFVFVMLARWREAGSSRLAKNVRLKHVKRLVQVAWVCNALLISPSTWLAAPASLCSILEGINCAHG
jgi:hypothetical protein